ncbi:Na+-transporting NADH:ubiquinone oxidoreductase subunit C [Desulfobotulus alkaliphilus]|uniref:Na(+)-translocating NADH-quinone reductase subunit C n=1 Tax=Desulfobotulus alkaliphilus TaxID=622671 RepID=A0A562S209_9BACT|nr:FMN-binding protein [Desulfobotulus alkaliphilus]TWI75371.1 Na+-transporting NADH:ubiquinone oxidoreductase subunit C [Desulfobotulus alkaliphilus]
MSESRSIRFTLYLCLVCSILLTAAATGLKPRQEANARLDRQKNVLKAAGLLPEDRKLNAGEVEALFSTRIRAVTADGEGRPMEAENGTTLHFFLQTDSSGTISEGYVLPLESRGLWGKIYGYLAMEADGIHISGFTVYAHQETPGLGGDIESRSFQQSFTGKAILDEKMNFRGLRVAKGKAPSDDPHSVDGISGATLTGNYLSEGILDVLKKFEPVSARFRAGEGDAYLMKETP